MDQEFTSYVDLRRIDVCKRVFLEGTNTAPHRMRISTRLRGNASLYLSSPEILHIKYTRHKRLYSSEGMVAMHSLEGTLIDHYRIGERIAKGGMSEIYLAQDVDTQQTVALKLVHRSNLEHCERFQHEVQTIAALSHPHIISALAYGTHASWCYLVTPYFANGTLDKQLSQ